VGTPYYLSPELCEDKPYDDRSDVWALGVILYECCMLAHPFQAKNQCALILRIIRGKFEAVTKGQVCETLRSLVRQLLTRDSSKRPSVKTILGQHCVQEAMTRAGLELPGDIKICPAQLEVHVQRCASGSK
ncbi:unnamed protein product, partial [Chrysoparadoxa australica]